MGIFESEKFKELKHILKESGEDFWKSFWFGLKINGIMLGIILIFYIIAKIFGFDLLYETNFQLSDFLGGSCIFLIVLALLFVGAAFILFNSQHHRNTKYPGENKVGLLLKK